MSVVTMIVPCGFKIKSKVDIDKFMNERCSINHPMGEKEYKIMFTVC